MERKIVAVLIIFFLLVNLYPFIHGSLSAPPDTVFLGTVHYPIDYLYYLSHITQGQDHLLRTSYLSTTESMPDLFIGTVYVLLGKVGYIFRISPIIMYQIGLAGFGFFFLLGAYLVIQQIFPDSKGKRIGTFLLFMFSNTLPRIVEEGGKTILAPYFSWYNYGEPFLRFSAVPHHLIIQAAIFFTILPFLRYATSSQKMKNVWIMSAILNSLVLASMQPIQWILLVCILCCFASIKSVYSIQKTHEKVSFTVLKKYLSHNLPLFVFIFTGVPAGLYLKSVFSREPFLSTNLWEAAQSPILLEWQFIQYHGIALILGIFGIPFFLKTKNPARFLIASITAISLAIFFLPFSRTLPVLTFRYLSSLPILFYAACSVQIVYSVSKITRVFEPFTKSVFFTLLFFLLVPLFFVQMNYKIVLLTPSHGLDPNIFLNKEIYALFLQARRISTPQDTFLVFHPYQSIFQAVAGRRQYVVTKFSTIDYDRKAAEIYTYLDANKPHTEFLEFLTRNGITYIVVDSTQSLDSYSFLNVVEKNNFLTIYKVIRD